MTLGLFAAMMLGATSIGKAECVEFTTYCGAQTYACGENEEERLADASFKTLIFCILTMQEAENDD